MSRSFFSPSAWRGTHRPATRTTKTSSGSILGDLLVRFGWVKPTLEPEDLYAETVREAASRRANLRAQLSAMHKNDSRRGGVERELRRHTLVVLSGGRS